MKVFNKSIFILIFVVLLTGFLPGFLFSQDVIAYIGEVGGNVTIMSDNPGTKIDAKPGMLLNAGDTIKTEENSYASIIFQDDGSRIKLDANALLTLNATRQEKKLKKRMFLETGKIWAKVARKRGMDFEIKTPTSVASVKGTRFALEELVWGQSKLWVFEEFVLFSNGKVQQMVGPGQKGTATEDTIEVEDINIDDVPLEPGKHKIIFYIKNEDSSVQKELHIELVK